MAGWATIPGTDLKGPQGEPGEQGPPGQNLSGYGVEVMSRQVGMAWWRQGLGRRWYNQVSIFPMGSSTTAGSVATAVERRWVERLVKSLQARYNPPGVAGGTMYKTSESGTASGSTSVVTEGLGLQSLSMASGATWTLVVPATTGFDVMFRQGPGSGSFRVQVDSGSQVTVTPSTSGATGRHDGVYSSPTLISGSHTVRITATNACVINAVYARNGDESTGVRLYNSGMGATLAADFVDSTTLYQRLGQTGPSLVPIMMGANDLDLDTPVATFKQQLKTIIAKSKQALSDYGRPPATYLLLGTYRRFDGNVAVTAYPWTAYLAAMNEVANEDPVNVAYADISIPFPTSQASDPYDLIYTDNLHMTDYGHAMMADLVLEALEATPQIVVPGLTGATPSLGDAMSVEVSTAANVTTANSTTWVVVPNTGLVFLAPPSGKVSLDLSAWVLQATAGQGTYLGPRVRQGDVVDTGTEVLPLDVGGNTRNCLTSNNANWVSASRPVLLLGLTPGASYNIQLWMRSSGSSTASSAYHRIVATPLLA